MRVERARQHDDAILAALAVAHDDHLADQVDVLDAKANAFEQAHAGAVEQVGEQAGLAAAASAAASSFASASTSFAALPVLAHPRQQGLHLDVTEDDRDALVRHGTAEPLQPRHVDAEHLAIEKEERAQRLAMRGGGNAPLIGEHRQEALDLRFAHLARMAPPARPAHEAAHPIDVRLLGT